MRLSPTALAFAPLLACYSGLPTGRAGAPCIVDQDCGSGMCVDGKCLPIDDTTTDVSAGSTSEETAGSTGGTTTTGTGSATTSTSGNTSTSTTSTTGGGPTTAATTSSSGSTGGPTECDPNDPNVEVDPLPGDMPGDPCCTARDSCTGKDVMGANPQESDVGTQLECLGGVWVADETSCTDNCEGNGNTYLGCFWDSYYGLGTVLCGCQAP